MKAADCANIKLRTGNDPYKCGSIEKEKIPMMITILLIAV